MMETPMMDYEHKVTNKIAENSEKPDFPQMQDYGITPSQLNSYLFDKQAILDSEGSLKSQYIVAGIWIVLPVIALSAIPVRSLPWGDWSLLVAIGTGIALFGVYKLICALIRKVRLGRLKQPNIETYITDILNY